MDSSHTEGVASIEKECFSDPWSENSLRQELENERAYFIVCTESGEILGYAGMYTVCGDGYICNIAVKEKFRRNGIGNLLLEELENEVKRQGGDFITLEVRQSNFSAIALYEKRGYVREGIRRSFYSHPDEDGIIMTKRKKVNES